MFKPELKNNRILQSQQVLNTLIALVRRYVPLDMKNTRPVVWINPRTAAPLSIREGDPVVVETPNRDGTLQGYVRLKAHLTESVHPQSISVPYGWWQGCEALGLKESGNRDGSANANDLVDDSFRDPVSGTIAMGSYPCRVRKE